MAFKMYILFRVRFKKNSTILQKKKNLGENCFPREVRREVDKSQCHLLVFRGYKLQIIKFQQLTLLLRLKRGYYTVNKKLIFFNFHVTTFF